MDNNFMKLREEKGFTQSQVARYLDCDTSTVRNWERGRSGSEMFDRVARLCKMFSCTPDRLTDSVLGELPAPKNKPIGSSKTNIKKQGTGND